MDLRQLWFLVLTLDGLLALAIPSSSSLDFKAKTYLSAPVELSPGQANGNFHVMQFPAGHIGIREFKAEMVDEEGNSVPLSQLYLHHWVVIRFKVQKDAAAASGLSQGNFRASHARTVEELMTKRGLGKTHYKRAENPGLCKGLSFSFGSGSETRRSLSTYPEPYGVEVGKPDADAATYGSAEEEQELWIAQIHVMDLRGTVDPWGCLECRCDLYNTTQDEAGRPLPQGYVGGFLCCYTGQTCELKEGYVGEKKKYFLRYTITYVEWNECVKPLSSFVLDVTSDSMGKNCKVEYDVPACEAHSSLGSCVHTAENSIYFPMEGNLVYAVGHQHYGGMGITLFAEDGKEICDSLPIYGRGNTAGDEAGYVVGMGRCSAADNQLDKPVVHVSANETLRIQSTYNRLGGHTGVMSLFAIGFDANPGAELPSHCNAAATGISHSWRRGRPLGAGPNGDKALKIMVSTASVLLVLLAFVAVAVAAMAASLGVTLPVRRNELQQHLQA